MKPEKSSSLPPSVGVLQRAVGSAKNYLAKFTQLPHLQASSAEESFLGKAKRKWSEATSSYSYSELKKKVRNLTTQLKEKTVVMTKSFLTLLTIILLNTVILPIMTLVILWLVIRSLFKSNEVTSYMGRSLPESH